MTVINGPNMANDNFSTNLKTIAVVTEYKNKIEFFSWIWLQKLLQQHRVRCKSFQSKLK